MERKMIYFEVAILALLIMIFLAGWSEIKDLKRQVAKLGDQIARSEEELSFYRELVTSRVVSNIRIFARGIIEKIEGDNLVLKADGDTLNFLLSGTTRIERLIFTEPLQPPAPNQPSPNPSGRKILERKDLKVGERVSITAKIEAGQLKAEIITLTVAPPSPR